MRVKAPDVLGEGSTPSGPGGPDTGGSCWMACALSRSTIMAAVALAACWIIHSRPAVIVSFEPFSALSSPWRVVASSGVSAPGCMAGGCCW